MSRLICLICLAAPGLLHAAGTAASDAGPLRAAYGVVRTLVDGDVARTTVTQVFVNDLPHGVEASYSFPLPADATVTGFAEWRDGRKLSAATRGKAEARAVYDAAVERGERAAHAETEAARFRMTLSEIPGHGSRRIELRYIQTLAALGGERTYVFPRGGDAPASTVLDVEVTLKTDRPLVAAEAPNQPDARISAEGAHTRHVRLSRGRAGLQRDLAVRWQQESTPLDLAARAVRPDPDRPAFVEARFAFDADPWGDTRAPRDLVIAIDTSLSMAGAPLKRARAAALAALDGLGPQDRVEVLAFADAADGAFGALVPADAATLAAARGFVEGLRAGGRSNFEAALTQAGAHLGAAQDGVLLLLTDGQPTLREGDDPFGVDVDPGAYAAARVVLGHFNYPGRTNVLTGLFPNVSARFVPDGAAGEAEVAALARLAVAPTIEDLGFEILGEGIHQVHGILPARIAVGEHVRLLGRADGPAEVKVTGMLHGEPVELSAPVVPRDGDDLGLPVEWARLRVADLDAELRGLDDVPTREVVAAEIRGLGIQYGLATRFTGYVMTDSLAPDHIKPGDPEIRVHAAEGAKAVFALLPWGEVVRCSWDAEEGLWLGRFLVPRATPDGLYKTRIFVEGQAGAELRGTLYFRVDSDVPDFELRREDDEAQPLIRGDWLHLLATPIGRDPDFGADGDHVAPDPVDVKWVKVRVGSRTYTLEREGEADVWSGKVLVDLPPGRHTLELVAMDYARNTVTAQLDVEVE